MLNPSFARCLMPPPPSSRLAMELGFSFGRAVGWMVCPLIEQFAPDDAAAMQRRALKTRLVADALHGDQWIHDISGSLSIAALVCLVCWCIWNERNAHVFDRAAMQVAHQGRGSPMVFSRVFVAVRFHSVASVWPFVLCLASMVGVGSLFSFVVGSEQSTPLSSVACI
jgi:hypothetical protein